MCKIGLQIGVDTGHTLNKYIKTSLSELPRYSPSMQSKRRKTAKGEGTLKKSVRAVKKNNDLTEMSLSSNAFTITSTHNKRKAEASKKRKGDDEKQVKVKRSLTDHLPSANNNSCKQSGIASPSRASGNFS